MLCMALTVSSSIIMLAVEQHNSIGRTNIPARPHTTSCALTPSHILPLILARPQPGHSLSTHQTNLEINPCLSIEVGQGKDIAVILIMLKWIHEYVYNQLYKSKTLLFYGSMVLWSILKRLHLFPLQHSHRLYPTGAVTRLLE